MAKTYSFVTVSNYVKITFTGYPTANSNFEARIYNTEKVVIQRDLNNGGFTLYVKGMAFLTFNASEVTAPSNDPAVLHDALSAMFGN